jgi:metallophosphoesterase (TIGR00282 family)
VRKGITALLLGDIVGQPGSRALFVGLKSLIKKHQADFVMVNGENAADGFGILPATVDRLLADGIHVVTSGNHIWQREEILPVLDRNPRLLRPANYPPGNPGKGSTVVEVKGAKIGVLNLQGREQMANIDCPFRSGKDLVGKLRKETKVIFVDFHAEIPMEKEAMAFHLDGLVTAVVGTHTHVPTADERILPGGTAFKSDLGMIGPMPSVIGSEKGRSIQRSMSQMPLKMQVADEPAVINGVLIEADPETGKALSIESVREVSSV